jgi:ATP-binding cassette, subfamily B, bacterial CvaB/MchF/RaxB
MDHRSATGGAAEVGMSGLLGQLFSAGREVPDIRQAEAAECGLACLAMACGYHRRPLTLNALRRQHPVSLKGMTLRTLMSTAQNLGFSSRPLRLELDQLGKLQLPAILHWDMAHYVLLAKASGDRLTIYDPALGKRVYTYAEASKHFTGIALELTPTPDFAPPPPARKLSFGELFGSISGLRSALIQIFALSLILQLYVLVTPFYMQLVVDNGIALNDGDFIQTLALGFAMLLLVNAGAAHLRALVLTNIQRSLTYQMGAGLFHHLLRLPLTYFEKRHVGDLVSRFASTEPVRRLIEDGLITALIDGLMAIFTGAMILIYSLKLGLIALGALGVYVLMRLVFFQRMRALSLDLMAARARESSTFIETMRAIQGIKLFNRQTERGAVWLNQYAEVIRADTQLDYLRQIFRNLNDLIFGAENILIVYIAAHDVLAGRMTVGMLFAFMSYKQQFVGKASTLVEKAIEFRMLDLHLDRLADITGEDPEPVGPSARLSAPLRGEIEARDLSFRYAEGEPYVFENVSFKIAPGEYVAITGPSGCGKTTLLKIMLGLMAPSTGEVLIDGKPLKLIGAEAYRENIGVVMQDDALLSGTIADNISFFDETSDEARIARSASLAAIHEDIIAMPMGYNSLIGDMGTSLSGGQRQRILLARALYRAPRILFMDEGTSSLDIATEQRVSSAVQELGLTRVIIAHRPETIATASRQITLGGASRLA